MYWLYYLTLAITPADIGVTDPITKDTQLVSGILTPIYTWAGIIAIIIIIVAGFYYVTSGGNAANVKKAKDAITGAVIGLVIIMLAFVITQFVIGRL